MNFIAVISHFVKLIRDSFFELKCFLSKHWEVGMSGGFLSGFGGFNIEYLINITTPLLTYLSLSAGCLIALITVAIKIIDLYRKIKNQQ